MSSSAALEVAVMQAVSVAYDIALKPREVALLCQMVENLVVGTPCGVMDQMTAACGEEGRLLALLCQPAELVGTIEVPHDLAIGGLDSGVRHSIGGEAYGDVRVGAFMGSRMIAEIEGLTLRDRAPDGTTQIDDPGWRGYLANLTPAEFERYAAHLPEAIRGAQFLSWFGWTTDSVARVSAYSACGLGSDETDLLVRLVKETGTKNGLFGARITGGGSGGTVAVIGRRDAADAITNLAKRYAEETGHQPYVFRGSSPGSAAFGFLRLVPDKRERDDREFEASYCDLVGTASRSSN